MKKIRLLIAALIVASAASAQNNYGDATGGEYKPTVYLISVYQSEEFAPDGDCCGAAEAAALNRATIANAIRDYNETHREGFQQPMRPQFIFATKNNKFSLALGGSINLRAGYDLKGIVDNIDFIPADIPVTGNYATQQKLMMFLEGIRRLSVFLLLQSAIRGPFKFYTKLLVLLHFLC